MNKMIILFKNCFIYISVGCELIDIVNESIELSVHVLFPVLKNKSVIVMFLLRIFSTVIPVSISDS